ncbi:MAG: hypothetical protein H6738_16570 [Alphaproteobacteria bacterium]|nr:hypothetical protein [Alphaproteobacteria bacterium]MCB9698396.1 hypothetical protein [Alphaproteobacteria bacterium]
MILAWWGLALASPWDDVTWYVIPNAAVDTDDGFGAGGRAEVAFLKEGHDPYWLSLVAQGYAATSGFQHHRFRLDRVGMGPHHRTRVTLHLAWRQWLNDGYFGIGNGTTRDVAFVGSFDADDPRRREYRYQLFQPFAHVTLRQQVGDTPWEVYGALQPKWSWITAYEGSLLEEEQPYGMGGGAVIQVLGGVMHDTRAPEIAPSRGHVAELGGRVAPSLGGEAGGFGGPILSLRGFAPVGGRLVLAGRWMSEWLFGTVPFYEMVHWGGAVPVQGFGGFESLRGIQLGRWRAPGKSIVNLEARTCIASLTVLKGHPLDLELAPYLDAGTVWGAEDPVPTNFPVHPAVGLGARAIFDETFVGRIDNGLGLDPVEQADGTVDDVWTWGFYLTFDHAF